MHGFYILIEPCTLIFCVIFFHCEIPIINMEKLLNLKAKIIEEFNSLGIEGLHLTDLNLLNGSYINLEYTLPNGQKVKLLEDDKMYLGIR